jgi:hypothetical protein
LNLISWWHFVTSDSVQLFETDSPVCFKHIRREGATKLVVSFTGMGKAVPFDFFKTFTCLGNDYDVLFLSDPQCRYYTRGVKGFAETENDIWMNIFKLGRYKDYYFVGTSMGGYAAIYHGCALADYAETTFDDYHVHILVLNPYMDPSVKFRHGRDLSQVVRPSKNLSAVRLVHGGADSDILQANLLRWTLPTQTTCYAECMHHNIAGWMKAKNLLSPLIEKFLN